MTFIAHQSVRSTKKNGFSGTWRFCSHNRQIICDYDALAALGLPHNPLTLDAFLEVFGSKDGARLGLAIDEAIETGSSIDHQAKLLKGDHAGAWCRIRGNWQSGENSPNQLSGVLIDIPAPIESDVSVTEIVPTPDWLSFADFSNNAIQGYDQNRRVIFWNKASEILYGYTTAEAIGQQIEDLIITDDRRLTVVESLNIWFAGGPAIEQGMRELKGKNGLVIPVLRNPILLHNAEGKKELYCVDTDLRMQQDFLQHGQDIATPSLSVHLDQNAAIWTWNSSSDAMYFSGKACEILCIDKNNPPKTRSNFFMLFSHWKQHELLLAFENAISGAAPMNLEVVRDTGLGKHVLLLQTEVRSAPSLSSLSGTILDITESKKGLDRLGRFSRLKTFITLLTKNPAYFDTIPLAMFIASSGFISRANRRLVEILDCQTSSLINEPISRIFNSKDSYDCYMNLMWSDEPEDKTAITEAPYEKEDGTIIWLRHTIYRVSDGEPDQCCICLIEDITDRKELEQEVWKGLAETISAKEFADSASRAKTDFLAIVSHEIRTPLSGVIGMQDLVLRDRTLQAKTRNQVELAQKNAQFLLTILNDVLDLSKIEAGKLTVEQVDFSIRELINQGVMFLSERASAKSIELILRIDDSLPEYLKGDPVRLRQVLVNLVGNAIKFTDIGQVEISISATNFDNGMNNIVFDITDTGIGMTPEALSRLFQKFEQADTSTTRRFGGTGLGLAICKQLVELMGGDIRVSSEVGKGSQFSFNLQLPDGIPPASDNQQILQPHTHQMRILCAEDFTTNQIIIRAFLEEMGHRVDIVENGRLALEALATTQYDMILMDGRMPEMDGATAIQLIRSGGREQFFIPDVTIPIIVVTANASAEDQRFYLDCGADDFLIKPIDEKQLHICLSRIIEKKLSEGENLLPISRGSLVDLDKLFSNPCDKKNLSPQEHQHAVPTQGSNAFGTQNESNLRNRLHSAFINDIDARLESLGRAFAEHDFTHLARIFHGLKGSASYIWPNGDLQRMSAQMEKASDGADWDFIGKNIAGFISYLKSIKQEPLS